MRLFDAGKKKNVTQKMSVQRRYILSEGSTFYTKESYKTLRTNIRFSLPGEGCKKFCVTSTLAGEGKSITILNLAISFAQTGKKVLLIDADLRRPSLNRLLQENGAPGLSNVLAGFCNVQEAIRTSAYEGLDVIYAGDVPPNPAELLGSSRMQQLLKTLSSHYDYVLIDTPPVGIVSDSCVLAPMLDGVLFVVRQNQTEKEAVAKGVRQLEMAGAKLMGFVLNGVDMSLGGKGNYKHSYEYMPGSSKN